VRYLDTNEIDGEFQDSEHYNCLDYVGIPLAGRESVLKATRVCHVTSSTHSDVYQIHDRGMKYSVIQLNYLS
jgi:hypothetical protein